MDQITLKKTKKLKPLTLIELLIVVAIIGILLTLLMPALSKARRSSMRAVCLSNLKTYSTATQLYLMDSSGKFPGHLNDADVHQGRSWIGKKGNSSTFHLDITERPLNKYIGLDEDGMEATAMKCPFNDEDIDVYHKVGSSYVANEYWDWSSLGNKYISSINNTSKVILATEFGAMGYLIHSSPNFWRQTHYPGTARYPFLKIDGSVTHHQVAEREGAYFDSSIITLNLDYD